MGKRGAENGNSHKKNTTIIEKPLHSRMFTPVVGGVLTLVICTVSIVLYIPVLCVFCRRPEFKSVLAYRLMFWVGVTDVGQLIVFDVSGIVATFQWAQFPYYVNKFLGSTMYALWFSMLFLSMITTINRFVSVVFTPYYSTVFDKNNVKVMYFASFLIFLIAWIVKLTPYSSYEFNMESLAWSYSKNDLWILSRLSHYCGTYGILLEVVCAVIAYTIIFAHILSQRKRSMKWSEVVLTTQHFFVSLLYVFGFIYWNFIDVWSTGGILTNFFSNLTWIIIIGLNPFIYLSVNRRLRKSVLVFIRVKKRGAEPTITVAPMCHTKTVLKAGSKWKKSVAETGRAA